MFIFIELLRRYKIILRDKTERMFLDRSETGLGFHPPTPMYTMYTPYVENPEKARKTGDRGCVHFQKSQCTHLYTHVHSMQPFRTPFA